MEIWLLYAVGSAVFAALTTILSKIGIDNVDSHLATAIRTVVVLLFAWLIVFLAGSQHGVYDISAETWVFLVLSGLATGGSWLCFFRALKIGDVNKVVPIDKSSTILTMVLAFIFLGEPAGLVTLAGMLLMGTGTWLMLEFKKTETEKTEKGWIIYALLAAVFASLMSIFTRIGISGIDASLWTALRTIVVIPLSFFMVFLTGGHKKIKSVDRKSWIFLILSGTATGLSWLCFNNALKLGNASVVVPIDKLSVALTIAFAGLFLKEKFTRRSIAGLILLTTGTLLPVIVNM